MSSFLLATINAALVTRANIFFVIFYVFFGFCSGLVSGCFSPKVNSFEACLAATGVFGVSVILAFVYDVFICLDTLASWIFEPRVATSMSRMERARAFACDLAGKVSPGVCGGWEKWFIDAKVAGVGVGTFVWKFLCSLVKPFISAPFFFLGVCIGVSAGRYLRTKREWGLKVLCSFSWVRDKLGVIDQRFIPLESCVVGCRGCTYRNWVEKLFGVKVGKSLEQELLVVMSASASSDEVKRLKHNWALEGDALVKLWCIRSVLGVRGAHPADVSATLQTLATNECMKNSLIVRGVFEDISCARGDQDVVMSAKSAGTVFEALVAVVYAHCLTVESKLSFSKAVLKTLSSGAVVNTKLSSA